MIRKLTGLVDAITDDGVIIDVSGVGYYVNCPVSVLKSLPPHGQSIALWIATQMSEHAITLYGFIRLEQLEWFNLLGSVHGVGHKVALGLLGVMGTEMLRDAIIRGDSVLLLQSPGIGKRLAERIVNELKSKAPPLSAEIISVANDILHGAVSALVHLGYGEHRARLAASKVIAANENQPIEETIKACLKELAP